MNILEKHLEDLIYDNIKDGNVDLLSRRGLYFLKKYKAYKRQLELGDYGRADLVGFDYNPYSEYYRNCSKILDVGVIEIKKDEININTFLQAIRYCKGIQKYLEHRFPTIQPEFKIFLIGTTISVTDFCYVTDFVSNLSIYTTKIHLEHGIHFHEECEYSVSNATLSKGDAKFESFLFENIKKGMSKKIDSDRLVHGTSLPF